MTRGHVQRVDHGVEDPIEALDHRPELGAHLLRLGALGELSGDRRLGEPERRVLHALDLAGDGEIEADPEAGAEEDGERDQHMGRRDGLVGLDGVRVRAGLGALEQRVVDPRARVAQRVAIAQHGALHHLAGRRVPRALAELVLRRRSRGAVGLEGARRGHEPIARVVGLDRLVRAGEGLVGVTQPVAHAADPGGPLRHLVRGRRRLKLTVRLIDRHPEVAHRADRHGVLLVKHGVGVVGHPQPVRGVEPQRHRDEDQHRVREESARAQLQVPDHRASFPRAGPSRSMAQSSGRVATCARRTRPRQSDDHALP